MNPVTGKQKQNNQKELLICNSINWIRNREEDRQWTNIIYQEDRIDTSKILSVLAYFPSDQLFVFQTCGTTLVSRQAWTVVRVC